MQVPCFFWLGTTVFDRNSHKGCSCCRYQVTYLATLCVSVTEMRVYKHYVGYRLIRNMAHCCLPTSVPVGRRPAQTCFQNHDSIFKARACSLGRSRGTRTAQTASFQSNNFLFNYSRS